MWHIEMYSHGYVSQHNENSIPSGFFDLCYNHTHTQKKVGNCEHVYAAKKPHDSFEMQNSDYIKPKLKLFSQLRKKIHIL